MIIIHTFGDSHSLFGWRHVCMPEVKINIHHIGAKLMHSFGRDKLGLLNITDGGFDVNPGDHVCFCFGEIDCRCHIHKYKHNYEHVIASVVTDYFKAVKLNVDRAKGIKPMIFNVAPAARIVRGTPSDPDYPHLGTNEDRKTYTAVMNTRLAEGCLKYGYLFVDLYKEYSDTDGLMCSRLSDSSGVHIDDPEYLQIWIRNNL